MCVQPSAPPPPAAASPVCKWHQAQAPTGKNPGFQLENKISLSIRVEPFENRVLLYLNIFGILLLGIISGAIGCYLSAIGRYFGSFGKIWYHRRVPTEYI